MERLKSNSFLLFWALLGLAAMIFIWFLPWKFQVNDDVIMMWLVSGAYTGTPESYAVFIHPILSWTFSKLYTFNPEFNWYGATWFLVIFLSYLGFLASLSRTRMGYYEKNILSIFCLCLCLHFGLFLQFTIVAGIASFSGILLFVSNNEISYRLYIVSITLIACSIMIRWEASLLIFFGFGFYCLSFKSAKEIVRYIKQVLIPCVILVILVGSKMAWERHSKYADFVRYNTARAAVSDHPVTYRLVSKESLAQDSKWFFFSQWMMEGEGLSIAELKIRKAELDNELFTIDQVANSFSRLFLVMRAEAFKSTFSLFLLFLYFYRFKCNRESAIFFVCWMIFFLFFNHFFILNGRVVILFFLPILYPIVLESALKLFDKKVFQIVSALLIIFFGYHLFNFSKESRARKIMQKEFISLTRKLSSESLLVMEGYKENYLGINFTMENPVPFLSLGWISQSPFQGRKLKNLGLDQVLEAKEFYLLGVDANEEFFFPEYMKFLGGNYELESRTKEDNFILFHYSDKH